jgi:nitrogen-specific signal transduction histidine kinase/FixJ family two-component response regulator
MERLMQGNSPAILLVDDEEQCLLSLKILLQLEGYADIVTVSDSREVMELLNSHNFSAAFIDLAMPHISGYELLKQMRESSPDLPVIVVTASADVASVVACLRGGAVDYIAKPINKNLLLPSVKRAVELFELRRENKLLKNFLLADDAAAEKLTVDGRTGYQNENLLLKTRKEYRSLLRRIPIPVFLSKADGGDILFYNDAYARFFGLTKSATGLDQHLSLFDCFDAQHIEYIASEIAAHGGVANYEMQGITPKRYDFTIIFNCEECGNEGVISGCFIDITEYQKLQVQLRQSQKIEAVGRLAGGIAHDFNNVLSSVAGYADMIAFEAEESTSFSEYAREILRAVESATNLTNQLTTFSRKKALNPKQLQIHAVFEEVRGMLCRLLSAGVTLCFELNASCDTVSISPGQLEQIIINLVINAQEAIRNVGEITVRTENVHTHDLVHSNWDPEPTEPHIAISVSDNGHGMSEGTKNKVFDPMFTTKQDGTGLGLSTVFGIVEQNNGHIDVETTLDVGTSFTIWFPLVRDAKESGVLSQK